MQCTVLVPGICALIPARQNEGVAYEFFRPVALDHASRLLNHGPTILITSRDESIDRRNVMAAARSMPVEFSRPHRDRGGQKRPVA